MEEVGQAKNETTETPVNIQAGSEYAVVFESVSLAYPGTDAMVLKDTSFAIRTGSTVALVGINGAGKTTVVRLIMGLYDNYSGNIYLGGINARSLSLEKRFEFISVMFQSFLKPNLTLKEAVALGQESDSIIAVNALQNSGFDSDTLEKSLDIPLTKAFSNNGWIPSGGQWQKIAMARMFYRNTPCFVLDEPSSSLDPQAELDMFHTLSSLKGEKTILFITHRLASIIDADEVLFLSAGGHMVQDTHQNLMKNSDEYSALYRAQAERYVLN